ncbi:hypothetical protein [Microbacterium halophytorum]|uniref:hypothetical protein n=1 Tax=Microbacterium halophytorum TaxID=2067568 RepID=UPI000CFAD914|nr:hypothetical protein [Microbacterium halophytorum]
MEFTGVEDCGNSPKNLRLAQWERALALGAWGDVAAMLSDDTRLEIAVHGSLDAVTGGDVSDRLRDIRGELVGGAVEAALSHGREGATWGVWRRPDGAVQFAHAFRFATVKADRFALIRFVHA